MRILSLLALGSVASGVGQRVVLIGLLTGLAAAACRVDLQAQVVTPAANSAAGAGSSIGTEADDLPVVVPLGKGSYASRPPRNQAARPGVAGKAGWGDLSQVFTHMKLWVAPGVKGAIPSTDWWTSLVTQRWSGQLWAYPGMVKAEPAGVLIQFPKKWELNDKGSKMKLVSASRLLVRGNGFKPESAEVESWSDWLVTFRMIEPAPAKGAFRVTIGHGLPFTWIETANAGVRVDVANAAFFDEAGVTAGGGNGTAAFAYTGSALGLETAGDCYGLYAPAGTRFERDGSGIAVKFAGAQRWLSVATLPARDQLAKFARYAPVVPRKTQVDWAYDPAKAEVSTNWILETQNLAGLPELDVIQGWIPHHYNTARGAKPDFAFNGVTFATPRGEMRCAVGRRFGITWPFTGLLPELPAPEVTAGVANAYRPEVMRELISNYTEVTGYGTETYWGGKKILLYGKYLEMAHQLGMNQEAEVFKARLTEALTDWFTYEPGEPEHFYAMYPNWGSLMGFRTRDNEKPGIDVLQDHHFCYAYHIYAAALLAMNDPQFGEDYGEMAKLVVKDYANWDRSDTRLPMFRNFDPWCGHSWTGGPGSEDGNGMESSSESVQSWGAMFVLAEVLGDQQMRAAAAFGYASESRAVGEYWFDRDRKNIPHDLWPHLYNSNIGTGDIGWWTWFSGDDFWMHAIQWIPHSPLLKYLYEDQKFARLDYETMWKTKRTGGWDSNLGNDAGVGNLTLSYLQIFDPDGAAKIFDELWDNNRRTAHAKDESGPTYYRIHAGRALGQIRWDAWCDIPTSTVYRDTRTGQNIVVVYNAAKTARDAGFYDKGKRIATFSVPSQTLVSHVVETNSTRGVVRAPLASSTSFSTSAAVNPDVAAKKTRLAIEPAVALLSDRGTQKFTASVVDERGNKRVVTPTWRVVGRGAIDASGVFTPNGGGTFDHSREEIVAEAEGLVGRAFAAVEESRRVASLEVTPNAGKGNVIKVAVGGRVRFSAEALDQFKARYELPVSWSVTSGSTGAAKIDAAGNLAVSAAGDVVVTAEAGGLRVAIPVSVVKAEDVNLAAFKPTQTSSGEGAKAVDGDARSRWESDRSDPQWLTVDLEGAFDLRRVSLNWQNAAARSYRVEVSMDGSTWKPVAAIEDGKAGVREIPLTGARARYVRIYGITRTTQYGYSIFELEVNGVPLAR